jgi:hypothetical protein
MRQAALPIKAMSPCTSRFEAMCKDSSEPLRFYKSQHKIQQQSQGNQARDEIQRIHDLSSRNPSKARIKPRDSKKNRIDILKNTVSFMRASNGSSVFSCKSIWG